MQINAKILGLSTMIPKSLSEQSIYISSDALEGVQLPAPEKILRAEAYWSEEESEEREGLGGETIYTAFALSSCFLGPNRVQPPATKEDELCIPGALSGNSSSRQSLAAGLC